MLLPHSPSFLVVYAIARLSFTQKKPHIACGLLKNMLSKHKYSLIFTKNTYPATVKAVPAEYTSLSWLFMPERRMDIASQSIYFKNI
jgi:hypothetical protein